MAIVYGPNSLLLRLTFASPMLPKGEVQTVLGFERTDGGLVPPQTLAALVGVLWADELAPITDTSVGLARVEWETETQSGEASVGEQGEQTIDGVPPQVAVLTPKSSSEGKGRRFGGRNYWYGWLADDQVSEAGIITPGRLEAIEPAYAAFMDNFIDGEGAIALALPQSEQVGGGTPPNVPWPLVDDTSVSNRVATQRRRNR